MNKDDRRISSLYYNKKSRSDKFKFKNKNEFINWYKQQGDTCHYCGIKEHVLRELIDAKKLFSKRFLKRGRHLEIERKNSSKKSNVYSKENCVLACYFCNNDKSDVFSEDEYYNKMKSAIRIRRKLMEEKYKSLLEK